MTILKQLWSWPWGSPLFKKNEEVINSLIPTPKRPPFMFPLTYLTQYWTQRKWTKTRDFYHRNKFDNHIYPQLFSSCCFVWVSYLSDCMLFPLPYLTGLRILISNNYLQVSNITETDKRIVIFNTRVSLDKFIYSSFCFVRTRHPLYRSACCLSYLSVKSCSRRFLNFSTYEVFSCFSL